MFAAVLNVDLSVDRPARHPTMRENTERASLDMSPMRGAAQNLQLLRPVLVRCELHKRLAMRTDKRQMGKRTENSRVKT